MNFKACSAVVSAFAMSLMLAACGSDDNSSNVERGDEDSSSSVEETSSSSVAESSSSEDANVPKGTRAATLDDLKKNMTLGEMFDTEVFFATGNKQGVFSFWIEDPAPAWIAARSDFKGGVIKVSTDNGSFMGADSKSGDEMQAFFEKGATFKFIVNEKDQLQVSVNDGDYKDVKDSPAEVDPNDISNASELQGVKLACKNDSLKLSQTYSFYKSHYFVEEKDGETASWSAGSYDIQRGSLLMLTELFDKEAYSMVTATVDKKFNMTIQAVAAMECEKSEVESKEIESENLVGTWVAYDDNVKWTLKLESNGAYSIESSLKKVPQEKRSGIWAVYGDQLMLMNKSCTAKEGEESCKTAVKGSVEKLDPEKGFTYKHDDKASIPTEWGLPQYE
jgi:hypothetical protein